MSPLRRGDPAREVHEPLVVLLPALPAATAAVNPLAVLHAQGELVKTLDRAIKTIHYCYVNVTFFWRRCRRRRRDGHSNFSALPSISL